MKLPPIPRAPEFLDQLGQIVQLAHNQILSNPSLTDFSSPPIYKTIQLMPSARLAYFDNLKAVLIFFVVFGHALPLFGNFPPTNSLITLIYTFHLYLFVFVSGIFSASLIHRPKLIRSLLTLAASYLSLSALNYLLVFFSFPIDPSALSLLYPYAFLWFIVSLFCYRATVPFVTPLLHRHPLLNLALVLISAMLLGSKVDFTWPLSLSNTVHFYPFFVLGLTLGTRYTLDLIRRLPLLPIIILAGLYTWYLSGLIGNHASALAWLLGHTSLRLIPAASLAAFLKNLGLIYLLGSLNSLVILKLIPHPPQSITWIGRHTLFIYLAHYYPLLLVADIFRRSLPGTWLSNLLLAAAFSLFLTFALALLARRLHSRRQSFE
jgi:fucose 4-O-acetylase-like acetyltransferase